MNHRGNILHPGSVPWRAHPCPALLPRTMIERRRGGSQSEMTKRRAILGRKNSSRSPHDIVGALVCWARSSVDARADATTSFVHDGFHHHTKLHETREQHQGKDTQRRTCNEDETRRVADYYTRRRKGIEERASLGEMGWVFLEDRDGGEASRVFGRRNRGERIWKTEEETRWTDGRSNQGSLGTALTWLQLPRVTRVGSLTCSFLSLCLLYSGGCHPLWVRL